MKRARVQLSLSSLALMSALQSLNAKNYQHYFGSKFLIGVFVVNYIALLACVFWISKVKEDPNSEKRLSILAISIGVVITLISQGILVAPSGIPTLEKDGIVVNKECNFLFASYLLGFLAGTFSYLLMRFFSRNPQEKSVEKRGTYYRRYQICSETVSSS